MKWEANIICNNGSTAASTSSFGFSWSVLRWRDVFGDVAMDTMQAASGGRSVLESRRLEWGLPTDLRVRWLIQSESRLFLGVGGGPGRVFDNRTSKAHIT